MFVQSNDWFFAPGPDGIALFDADGNPISGDITSQVFLWNAGTEVDEEPGIGPNQGPRQKGPNTGKTENGVVRNLSDEPRWTLEVGDQPHCTDWLIDASGRSGFLARRTRIEDRSTGTLALVGRWRREGGWDGDDRSHTLIESYADGWAWGCRWSRA